MKTWKMAVAMGWMAAGAACYGASDNLTVVMFDSAGVPRAVLDTAGKEAQWVFRAADVQTNWSVCQGSSDPTQHCLLPPAGSYVQVRIMGRAVDDTSHSRSNFARGAYATRCAPEERCFTAYVDYATVLAYARVAEQPVGVALAYVMAHEIGHLMGLEHSPCGVMKADFNRHDLQDAAASRLRFAADDARRLRSAVTRWAGSATPALVAEAR